MSCKTCGAPDRAPHASNCLAAKLSRSHRKTARRQGIPYKGNGNVRQIDPGNQVVIRGAGLRNIVDTLRRILPRDVLFREHATERAMLRVEVRQAHPDGRGHFRVSCNVPIVPDEQNNVVLQIPHGQIVAIHHPPIPEDWIQRRGFVAMERLVVGDMVVVDPVLGIARRVQHGQEADGVVMNVEAAYIGAQGVRRVGVAIRR